ncbi:MAG: hypothetical protein RML40_06135 [Bacteroidota bacterium]|nr:hypothetical protein [Candidatus Kapabacteria bacterium]MDW8220093.1 hypothetical protein [Bacteroidota bacterium]
MRELSGVILLVLLGGTAWVFLYGGGTYALSPLDWTIGLLTLLWLITIVTVPWNIYFQTRTVLAEAEESRRRAIPVAEDKIAYTKRWSERALLLALGLHLATAAGMYALSVAGISFIGYFGAGAALILTFVRPIARGYDYVRKRLSAILQEITYPREDVVTLKNKLADLENTVKALEQRLDTTEPSSWAAGQIRATEALQAKLDQLRQRLDSFIETNKLEHEQITRDAQNSMAQAMADAAIVNHVREILRFIKSA